MSLWCAASSLHWGLRPGPSVYKTDALPLSYRGHSAESPSKVPVPVKRNLAAGVRDVVAAGDRSGLKPTPNHRGECCCVTTASYPTGWGAKFAWQQRSQPELPCQLSTQLSAWQHNVYSGHETIFFLKTLICAVGLLGHWA